MAIRTKSRTLYFILILSSILFSQVVSEEGIRVDDTIFDEIQNSIKVRNYNEEISELENTTDLTYLTYYYRKTNDNSLFGAYFIKSIDRKLNNLAMILLIDCDIVIPRNLPNCQGDIPKIKLLVPPIYKFDPKTKRMNNHREIDFTEDSVTQDSIFKFVSDHLPTYSTKITSEHMETFLNQPLFNKILLFTEKENTPNLYKGLASIYYDRILFGEVKSDNEEIVNRFDVTSFPAIVAVENPFLLRDNYTYHHYEGNINSQDISDFIEQFALREKNYIRRMRDMKADKSPFLRLNSLNYESFLESGDRAKIIYFSNGHLNITKIPEDIKRFAAQSSGYFQFGIFDCQNLKKLCKSELYVDVDRLPALYIYNPHSDLTEMTKNNRLLPATYSKLLNYFMQRIESNITKIETNEDVYDMIQMDRDNHKYPIIYFHKNETKVNLPLYLLSSIPEYRQKVTFYEFNQPSDELLGILKITYKEPFTLIFLHDKTEDKNFRIHKFEDSFKRNFPGLKTFVENFVGDYVFPIEPTIFTENKLRKSIKTFTLVEDYTHLMRNCAQSSSACVIALLNGEYDEEIKRGNLNYRDNLKTLNKFASEGNYENVNMVYVNATCHDELSNTFRVRVDEMPALVYYDSQNKIYFKSSEELNLKNIKLFLEDAFEKKLPFRNLETNKIKFSSKYCEEKIEKLNKIDFNKWEEEDEEEVKNEDL